MKTRSKKIDIFNRLLSEELDVEAQIALLKQLPELSMSGVELAEMAKAAMALSAPVDLGNPEVADLVGTGGDKSGTFNISTTSAILAAACDVPIAKHGNRAVTSQSGSFDCLRALNIPIHETPKAAKQQFEETGITFLFAPFFHPAFRRVADARKALAAEGYRSVFNCLGTLLNPAHVKHIVLGVYDKRLLMPMAEALQILGVQRALVCHGDGLDELSIESMNDMVMLNDGELKRECLNPKSLELRAGKPEDLLGGDAVHNARITEDILSGKLGGAKREIVLVNTAAVLVIAKDLNFHRALTDAEVTLDQGKAYEVLQRLRGRH